MLKNNIKGPGSFLGQLSEEEKKEMRMALFAVVLLTCISLITIGIIWISVKIL